MSDDTKVADGLFGPGIFGTGIDLSALDEDTAYRLGIWVGEQLRKAGDDIRHLALQRDRERAQRRADVSKLDALIRKISAERDECCAAQQQALRDRESVEAEMDRRLDEAVSRPPVLAEGLTVLIGDQHWDVFRWWPATDDNLSMLVRLTPTLAAWERELLEGQGSS